MEKLKLTWQTLDIEEKVLIGALVTVLMHFTITFAAIIIVILMMFWKQRIGQIRTQNKHFNLISVLMLSNMGVSILRSNPLGFTFSIFIYLIYLIGCYINIKLSTERINFVLEVLCKGGFFVFIYNIIGELINRYVISFGITNYSRVLFLNENYAATVYTFIILCATYLFSISREKKYILVILMNIFLINQADSRGAIIGAMLGIVTYILIINRSILHQYRYYILFGLLMIFTYIMLSIFKVVPPIKFGIIYKYITYRIGIWQTAYLAFLEHPFLGYGQFSHLTYCNIYGTMCIIHAHNLYLELLVSFGVFGTMVLGYLGFNKIKSLKQVIVLNRNLFALTASVIVATLFHGLVDYQIFWVQPGLFFVFLMMISNIVIKSSEKEEN